MQEREGGELPSTDCNDIETDEDDITSKLLAADELPTYITIKDPTHHCSPSIAALQEREGGELSSADWNEIETDEDDTATNLLAADELPVLKESSRL